MRWWDGWSLEIRHKLDYNHSHNCESTINDSQEWIIVHPFNHCSHTFIIKPKFMILVSHFSPFNIDHPSRVTTGSTPWWVQAPNPISTALFRVVGAYLGFHWTWENKVLNRHVDQLDHVDLLFFIHLESHGSTDRYDQLMCWIKLRLPRNCHRTWGSRHLRPMAPDYAIHTEIQINFAAWQTQIWALLFGQKIMVVPKSSLFTFTH